MHISSRMLEGSKTAKFLFCQQESNSKLPKEVCSRSHGMTPSELGQVVRADHDYIDLLVKVKNEDSDEDEIREGITDSPDEVPIDIKEEVIDDDSEEADADEGKRKIYIHGGALKFEHYNIILCCNYAT